jgi:predicted esterase
MIERTIATTTHGRFLVEPAAGTGPAPMLVGFHGYGESADIQLDRLRAISPAAEWTTVSVQGLHRFYDRRASDVVASWMTRQDRELAIADNLAYVSAVVDEVARDRAPTHIVFAGFSQGVAMTFRAAAASHRPVHGVVVAGGDIPPEIDAAALARVGAALICRGAADAWYTAAIFGEDVRRLRAANVAVEPLEFDGGHEWSAEVISAATKFLQRLRS